MVVGQVVSGINNIYQVRVSLKGLYLEKNPLETFTGITSSMLTKAGMIHQLIFLIFVFFIYNLSVQEKC